MDKLKENALNELKQDTEENEENAMMFTQNGLEKLKERDNQLKDLEMKIADRLKKLQNILVANENVMQTNSPGIRELIEILNTEIDLNNSDQKSNVTTKETSSSTVIASEDRMESSKEPK